MDGLVHFRIAYFLEHSLAYFDLVDVDHLFLIVYRFFFVFDVDCLFLLLSGLSISTVAIF